MGGPAFRVVKRLGTPERAAMATPRGPVGSAVLRTGSTSLFISAFARVPSVAERHASNA
jgi:hypothetical protein